MSANLPEQTTHLTRYVAQFICDAKLADLPADVVALGGDVASLAAVPAECPLSMDPTPSLSYVGCRS